MRQNRLTETEKAALLMEKICRKMVASPDVLNAKKTHIGPVTVLQIYASKEDTGRLIGSGAMHYRNLSKLFGAMAGTDKISFSVEEPVTTRKSQLPAWNAKEQEALLEAVVIQIFKEQPAIEWKDTGSTTLVSVSLPRLWKNSHVSAIEESLKVIFEAIGRVNGRIVNLWLSQEETSQPATADGRFTREA